MFALAKTVLATTALVGGLLAQCGGGPPPPPRTLVLGDSEAALVGDALPNADNQAVGGSTVCDTASALPTTSDPNVLVHVGGHSWGNYDATTAQRCLRRIVDAYAGKRVLVALSPTPMAIYCADPVAVSLAEAAGNPHVNGDYEYELHQRVEDMNKYKLAPPTPWPSNVKIVDWRGIEHYGYPDCTHFTPTGAAQAATITEGAINA